MFKKELPSLSLINAEAQHEFWKRDLGFAEQYLKYVYTFQGRDLPNYDKILSIAERDVEVSKKGLAKSIKTLEKAKKL
tara:strand:- start:2036 stop:2269 length:234 start_codon:yes stop_codon:yes gene_type:complete